MSVNKIELYKALLEIVHQYSIGNGPLDKYKEQNDKIIEMAKENPNLFRYLGCEEI